MEKLIVLAPLAYALFVAIKTGDKALRGGPMTADDKESMREVVRGIIYLIAAAVLVLFFTPDFGLWLTILWTLLTLIFAVVGILCVIELKDTPKRKALHNRIWKPGPKTPLYSKSGEPVEHIRWLRRILLGVLIFVAIICGAVSAFDTTSTADEARGAAPTTSAPADTGGSSTTSTPSPTAPATAAPSSTTPATAPAVFKNECGGLDPKKVNNPNATIEFGTGLDETGNPRLWICHNGDWVQWSEISSDPAPAAPPLTYWIANPEKKNEGYGVVVINNKPYLFWATKVNY